MNDPARCYFCDDPLTVGQDFAHPECVDASYRDDPRTCRVCLEQLPQDIDDHGLHAECVIDAWLVGPDPFLEHDKASDPKDGGSEG